MLLVSPQASVDAESVGNCPFCQRLFMILWLKGANFTLNTVDMRRWRFHHVGDVGLRDAMLILLLFQSP